MSMAGEQRKFYGALFDLDGVLVDTAKYHYYAWRRLADELGFVFSEEDSERTKGVSRMQSLEIVLEIGGLSFSTAEKQELAARKNAWYVEYLHNMQQSELFPGVRTCLAELRRRGVKIALASASKNAGLILDKLDIHGLFDAVIDGNKTTASKPNPEVFIKGAGECGLPPSDCVVFEDAQSGVEAGLAAGCYVVGIGKAEHLSGAQMICEGIHSFVIDELF